jgi:uncharacterized protein YbjT (DUF2867 family)
MTQTPRSMPVIAVAGASGFVGRHLLEPLSHTHHVRAISRKVREVSQPVDSTDFAQGTISWHKADLFSVNETAEALSGASQAIYLVHSMMPHARLVQGRFDDLDLLIADNFARACHRVGVRRIIYLGGLLPSADSKLSAHLRSRFEVESVLAAYGAEVVTVRAGLIIGPGGSSWTMMERLIKRLPVMICPSWTQTVSQPISLSDIVQVLTMIVQKKQLQAGAWEVGGREQMSWLAMMQRVARILGRTRLFLPVPFFSPGLSRLWVSLLTGHPKELVAPLVQSLSCSMTVQGPNLVDELGIEPQSFDDSVRAAMGASREPRGVARPASAAASLITSLQAVPLASRALAWSVQRWSFEESALRGRTMAWVASEYARFVTRFLFPLVHVEIKVRGEAVPELRFWLKILVGKILLLRLYPESALDDRAVFRVSGGVLARPAGGKLEFRAVGRSQIMAVVSNFEPALPWWIYRWTQATAHLWIMKNFGRHLQRKIH